MIISLAVIVVSLELVARRDRDGRATIQPARARASRIPDARV
jgi:hypothetical protein